jgi:hypothetical protein
MFGIEMYIESTIKKEFLNIEDCTLRNQMAVINKKLNDNYFAEWIILDVIYEQVKEKISFSYDLLEIKLQAFDDKTSLEELKDFVDKQVMIDNLKFNIIKYKDGVNPEYSEQISYLDIKDKIQLLKKRKKDIIIKQNASVVNSEYEDRVYLFYNEKFDCIFYTTYELNQFEKDMIAEEKILLDEEMKKFMNNDVFYMSILDVNGKVLYSNVASLESKYFDGNQFRKEYFDIVKTKVNQYENAKISVNGIEEEQRIAVYFIDGRYFIISKVVESGKIIGINLTIIRLILLIGIIVAFCAQNIIDPNIKLIKKVKNEAGENNETC